MRFLALDLGSSYTKCFVLEEGKCMESMQLPAAPRLKTAATRFEVDAEAYYQNVNLLLDKMGAIPFDGVLLSTQMHGFVLTDDAFQPVTPYISWQDRACTEQGPGGETWREILQKQLDQDAFLDSGVPLKESLALCNLFARMGSGLILSEGIRLCTLGGYILGRMGGIHACHISNAGPLGIADMRRGGWNEKVLLSAGMGRLCLPKMLTSLSPCGEAAVRGRHVTLYPDLGDQQVCAFGAGLESETGLHVNIGTAGLIGAVCGQWLDGPFENRAWLVPGYFLRTVSGLPGGRDIALVQAWLARRESLSDAAAWKRMCFAACTDPPLLPWDFSRMESFLDTLPAGYTPEEIICSLYREIAVRYAAAARGMMAGVTSVRFSGGSALKNPALRRAILAEFPQANLEEDMLKDVTLGMETLAKAVQIRMGK